MNNHQFQRESLDKSMTALYIRIFWPVYYSWGSWQHRSGLLEGGVFGWLINSRFGAWTRTGGKCTGSSLPPDTSIVGETYVLMLRLAVSTVIHPIRISVPNGTIIQVDANLDAGAITIDTT